MKFVNLKQDTPEWHDFRQNHIGASDAPVIMGVSPYRTIKQVWKEKVFGTKQKENGAMRYGKIKEDEAREEFEKETGHFVLPKVILHEDFDWMSASLDGLDIEQQFIVEIKCPGKVDHHFVEVNRMVPQKYIPQIQHQLCVTGLDFAYYYSFDGEKGIVLEVKRDQEFIEMMIEKEKDFWNCVQTFVPPKKQ